jgi:hypothetical protein
MWKNVDEAGSEWNYDTDGGANVLQNSIQQPRSLYQRIQTNED